METITNMRYNFQLISDSYHFKQGIDPNASFEYPVAPLVSSCYDKVDSNVLIARIILYIQKPDMPINLRLDPPEFKNGVLFLNCFYDAHYQSMGSLFEIWSLEFFCSLEDVKASMISVTLQNKDPKTSRGTVTCVQRQ